MTDAVNDVFGEAVEAAAEESSLIEFDVGNLYAFDPTPFEAKVSGLYTLHF